MGALAGHRSNATDVAEPLSRPLALVVLALTVAAALYGTGFWLMRDRGPDAAAFAPAAQLIRSGYQKDDLILLVPHYATRAREHLGDLHPLAVQNPLLEDFSRHRRVWVFGLFGEAEALRADLERAGLTLDESKTPSAGITVDRYTVDAPVAVHYRLVDHIKQASVVHEHNDGKRESCGRWSDNNHHNGPYGRWVCPHDSDWFFVSPQWHRMGDHLRLCLWAHPPNEGKLHIRFPDVPMTGSLIGRGGHTLNSAKHAKAPVHLDVKVGARAAQRFGFELEDTWRPFALRTPTTGTATVTFTVSSPNAGTNHFCFDAELRGGP